MAETFSERVDLVDTSGKITIRLDANSSTADVGQDGRSGVLIVRNGAGRESVRCDGDFAIIRIGAARNPGDLFVRDGQGVDIFRVEGAAAALRLGAKDNGGELSVRDGADREVLQFESASAALRIGAKENEGDLIVRDASGREVFHVNGAAAAVRIGTRDNEGDLSIHDVFDRQVFQFSAQNAVLRVGAQGNEGDIAVRDIDGNESIQLNGGTGDIVLRNADIAEQFGVSEAVDAVPGTVMALARDGLLMPAASAYDRTVVGVVAGGGRYRSGIVMDHRADAGGQWVPIAMVGKAACRVDTLHGPVRVGDLLTSSPTPGCAMPATDPSRAFGTVIGKALTPLDEGIGLVDMIISLQ